MNFEIKLVCHDTVFPNSNIGQSLSLVYLATNINTQTLYKVQYIKE